MLCWLMVTFDPGSPYLCTILNDIISFVLFAFYIKSNRIDRFLMARNLYMIADDVLPMTSISFAYTRNLAHLLANIFFSPPTKPFKAIFQIIRHCD